METWIVTGGAGFIGSNFVHRALARGDRRIVVLDKLTYAGHRESLAGAEGNPRFRFVAGDIADRALVRTLFAAERPAAVVNFAAESHVDRSIEAPGTFVETNVVGVFELLEAARGHLAGLPDGERERFRFLHVSTDEVYGSLGPTGLFTETTPYDPSSPYSASKAAADHLVHAWARTYGLPALLTNCSNNYGPYQYPEKLIPLMILNALEGRPLPIYGDGGNVRDWIYVGDHCEGIELALAHGRPGERYNLGGGNERTNLEVVAAICAALEAVRPARENPALAARGVTSYEALRTFVPDRPGHDRRYAIDATKAARELGWRARHDFTSGLAATVAWYLDHLDWCAAVQSGRYDRERLGLATAPAEGAK
ncbi:MAG: dTDP-glucose 4,6-dehydratase [Acidobacteria bacterium]|nr:dTDP-glucose 4,6-dehydratase [Thermoanaerobaculia bacterium]NLN11563.1 dTDP-glucose 4,6-dehydratase [Acidobacteriota bacterium]MBP8846449.1 dTDP-glucose 4,6-dehydratase [Thermoanaerobaculia bacterium]HRR14133.1 dTDP-glucose 4,6-dehydratase [Thermoanaerobaculia bacterium]HRS35907.1 dTDP-glucose 4,6-dehydratase [Thermoanaerobaculia bacterium]